MRRIAYEAADAGLLSPELAAGIRRVKGVRRIGVRLGNWLTPEQGRRLLESATPLTARELRDHAMVAMLIGCGLRRAELLALSRQGGCINPPWATSQGESVSEMEAGRRLKIQGAFFRMPLSRFFACSSGRSTDGSCGSFMETLGQQIVMLEAALQEPAGAAGVTLTVENGAILITPPL